MPSTATPKYTLPQRLVFLCYRDNLFETKESKFKTKDETEPQHIYAISKKISDSGGCGMNSDSA